MDGKSCAILVKHPDASVAEIMEKAEAAILQGCVRFLTGLELDGGLTAAECVLACRESNPAITLECVIPFEEYTTVWDEQSRDRYFDILGRCDSETLLQRHYTSDCLERQKAYLLRHAEATLVI